MARKTPKNGGRRPADGGRAAAIDERRRQVAALVLSGASYRQIGRALSIDPTTVCDDVKAIRKEWREERAEKYDELVDQECQRLDALLGRYWGAAWEGNQSAAELCLKLIREKAKILGLGTTQPQVEVSVNVYDPLEDLERSFRAVLAARGLLTVGEEPDGGGAPVVGERLALPLPAQSTAAGEGPER